MDIPASDFDGAWKYALEHYFADGLALFFPQVYAGIDWIYPVIDQPTALQQVNPEASTGKQYVDKLVQVVRRDGQPGLVFVHLEIQAQRHAAFAQRIYRYHSRIYDRDGHPVASLAILADNDPEWHPRSFSYEVWGTRLQLDFPTVKLLALDPAVLAASANPMATLSLIQRDAHTTRSNPDERMRRKLGHFRALFRKGYTAADMRHLVRMLDQMLRLDPARQDVTRAVMHQIEQEETGMDTFISDIEAAAFAEGKAEGEARGETKGQQALVLRQLTRRFGLLTPEHEAQIKALTPARIVALGEALFDLETLAELDAWLAGESGES